MGWLCLWKNCSPGAPLTYFNDGGVRQRFIFYTPKNPNFRICLPKKIPSFVSIPQKIPQYFCISKFYYLSSEITESATRVSDTSLYGFINHFGKLDVMLLIFSRELLHTTKMGSQLTGPLSSCWNSRFEFSLQNQFSLPLFLHSNVII